MTNVLTGAERFIAQWRQSTAEGNLYSPDDLATYIMGLAVVPGNGRQAATLATYLANNAVYNVKDFGAVGDGTTDCTAAIQAAITAASAGGMILFPVGSYHVTATLTVGVKNMIFAGMSKTNTGITYTGTGELFRLGTDNGQPYTTLVYDGTAEGFSMRDIYIHYSGTTDTASVDARFNYKAGTYGIRDWRGGEINLNNVRIVGFNYGFWGIQSDLNVWDNVTFETNHVGAFYGPASDQLVGTAIYSIGNDTMWQIQGCGGGKVFGWTSDSDGATTSYPCQWGNYNDGAGNIRPAYRWDFYSPWLERLGSLPLTVAIDAWFSLGYGDTNMNDVFCIHYPMVRTQYWNTAGLERSNYIVRADQLKCVQIEGPSGENGIYATNLKALVKVVNGGASATVPLVRHTDCDGENISFIENYSVTQVNAYVDGFQGVTYGVNVNGGTGPVSLIVSPTTSAPTLTATDHFVGVADVPGSTAVYRALVASGGHLLDFSYSGGARGLLNVNATEVALVTQNAFPLYLGVNNAYKWQVPNQAGISALFPLEALAYISCGTNGLSVRNNVGSRDNLKVDDSGTVLAFGAVGYIAGAGAGGTVAQATSKATGVTLNKVTGQITMNAAALAAGTIVSFVLTNSAIKNPDLLILNHVSGGTPGSYSLNARVTADGSATIDVRNNTGGSLSEAIVIGYTIMRGQTA